MLLRGVSAAALLVVALLGAGATGGDGALPAVSGAVTTLTTRADVTTRNLPRTALEAEQRDDGGSSAGWWIGSGVAAMAAIAIGGKVLARPT